MTFEDGHLRVHQFIHRILQRYKEYQNVCNVQTVMPRPPKIFCCCTDSCAARARLTLASVAIRCTRPQGWDMIWFIGRIHPQKETSYLSMEVQTSSDIILSIIYAITFEELAIASKYIVVSKQKMEIEEPHLL